MGNTPVWVLLDIRRLGRVRNTKFCTNACIKMLLNAECCKIPELQCLLFLINLGKINRAGSGGGGGGCKTAPTPPPILIYHTWLIYHIWLFQYFFFQYFFSIYFLSMVPAGFLIWKSFKTKCFLYIIERIFKKKDSFFEFVSGESFIEFQVKLHKSA